MYEVIKELKRILKDVRPVIIYKPNRGWDVSHGSHSIFIHESDIMGSINAKAEAEKYAKKLRHS